MECKLVVRKSTKTYKNSKGEEKHYYNTILCFANGREVQVRALNDMDQRTLSALATYEK